MLIIIQRHESVIEEFLLLGLLTEVLNKTMILNVSILLEFICINEFFHLTFYILMLTL